MKRKSELKLKYVIRTSIVFISLLGGFLRAQDIPTTYKDASKYIDKRAKEIQKIEDQNIALNQFNALLDTATKCCPQQAAKIKASMGVVLLRANYSDSALKAFKEVLLDFSQLGDTSGLLNTLNNIGVIYKDLGMYDSAMFYQIKSLSQAEKFRIPDVSSQLLNIGNLYSHMQNSDKALTYFRKCMIEALKFKNYRVLANCYLSAGVEFKLLKSDSAHFYQNKALNLGKELGDSIVIANSLVNMARIHTQNSL